MIGALREVGFEYVFDTNLGADITIIEEAAELANRLKNKQNLPMFTTCCPTWYRFVEKMYPDLINYLSTVKSPQAMLGSLVKTYFADQINVDYHDIVHVVIAPCMVKKEEAKKKDLWIYEKEDIPNIDYVLTTKETVELFNQFSIDFKSVEPSEFDNPLGESSGAGAIFGTSGGVMEAVIRTAYHFIEDKELEKYELNEIRNTAHKKDGRIKLSKYDLNIASINHLQEAKVIMDKLRSGEKVDYHFIEVMVCPMGCIGGAGQTAKDKEVLLKRREALFNYDKKHKVRAAHLNEHVKRLYDEYIGEVGSEKAKELLHTDYVDRSEYDGENFVCEL